MLHLFSIPPHCVLPEDECHLTETSNIEKEILENQISAVQTRIQNVRWGGAGLEYSGGFSRVCDPHYMISFLLIRMFQKNN